MIITTANLYLSFPAPTLHPKLVCQMEQRMGFISGCVCAKKEKKSVGILVFGKVPQVGSDFTTILRD